MTATTDSITSASGASNSPYLLISIARAPPGAKHRKSGQRVPADDKGTGAIDA